MVLPEPEAVERALSELGDGDLLLILADDVPAVLAQIRPFSDGSAAV